MSTEAIYAAIAAENQGRCSPPLEDDEVRRIAESVGRYAPPAGGGAPSPRGPLVVRRAAEILPEPVRWIWTGRIPAGMVSILDGPPGLGKSTITADLAARVSAGSLMPFREGERTEGRPVIILSYEDDAARVIRPRLEAAGADLELIHVVEGVRLADGDLLPPSLPEDLIEIERVVRCTGAALVIIDPLMAALSGDVDSHRDQDVRRVLSRLRALAEATGAAILAIRHLRKAPSGSAVTQGGGSIGIIGAARVGHLLARDPADSDRRILAPSKSNVGPLPRALSLRVESVTVSGGISTGGIVWLGECDATADELVAPPVDLDPNHETGAVARAVEFLRGELAAGPRTVASLRTEARAGALTWTAVRRAMGQADVEARKIGFRPGRWVWRMRGDARPVVEAAGEDGAAGTETPAPEVADA